MVGRLSSTILADNLALRFSLSQRISDGTVNDVLSFCDEFRRERGHLRQGSGSATSSPLIRCDRLAFRSASKCSRVVSMRHGLIRVETSTNSLSSFGTKSTGRIPTVLKQRVSVSPSIL